VPASWSLDTPGTGPKVAATPDGAFVVAGTAGPGAALDGTALSGLFVAKIAASGEDVLWAQSFAVTDLATVGALAVDEAGDVYVGGDTQSSKLTIGASTFTRPAKSIIDPYPALGFVAKLSGASGAPAWARGSIGGTTHVRAIAARGGIVAVAGAFTQAMGFGGPTLSAQRYGGYVYALDAGDGTAKWADGFDATGDTGAAANGVALDANGKLYAAIDWRGTLTGMAPAAAPPDPGAFQQGALIVAGSATDAGSPSGSARICRRRR
jgi:outer membrane protein assembly factor BamB